ncbi:hypothetical protein [Bradyrhizobium viridifuturi]|uniref:hypothetical protein n=1 Tax=Bradyrhizobium viridifuturi TaxID=1654716 RepID=UPI000FE1408E|nr:hypothetical protein [Bradyrhizobium viridifuturi]
MNQGLKIDQPDRRPVFSNKPTFQTSERHSAKGQQATSREPDETMLEALEDYVKRQKKRLVKPTERFRLQTLDEE